ncbi:hypothetical protein [Candidatus Hecatella orcuttiae]|uniref:hypothetical protein n=1 Tax=Candidatus Hecatella orcuttiae TaxID=1935119 RepID=UPI0028681908|nr:hypothetical protein [Candidatus Hecatella orcuttiae]
MKAALSGMTVADTITVYHPKTGRRLRLERTGSDRKLGICYYADRKQGVYVEDRSSFDQENEIEIIFH